MRITVVARRKLDRKKTLPLYVRVAAGGADRYVSLGLRVPAADWNGRRGEVRPGSPHAAQLNAHLAGVAARAQAAAHAVVASGREPTADRLKAAVARALAPEPDRPAGAPTVGAYGAALVADLFDAGKSSTAYFKQRAFRAFAESAPGALFGDVTPAVARAHVARLRRAKPGGAGLAPNTVYGHLSALKALARRADRDGVPGAADAVRALVSVRLERERTEKPRLPAGAFERLAALTADSDPALTGGWGEVARDAFVFSFYAGGMRWGDVATLRWSSVECRARDDDAGAPEFVSVSIRQRKTGRLSALPVVGGAAGVLARRWARSGPGAPEPDRSPFVFGLIDEADEADERRLTHKLGHRGSLVNRHLYRMQARLGIPETGFHAARHSFADHMRRRGAGLYAVSKALGHSSLRVTEQYLAAFDVEGVADAVRAAFEDPDGPGPDSDGDG